MNDNNTQAMSSSIIGDALQELAYIVNTPHASDISFADIDPVAQPLWELDNLFLNPFAEVPEVQTFADMGGRKALPTQGIVTFSAKPKQGKSLSILALLAAIITGNKFDTITPTEIKPRLCIVFDTEMDEATLHERVVSLRTRLGADANRYAVVSLLATPKAERLRAIESVTAKYNPDIVVIDQVAMLVSDYNNAEEAQAIKDRLLVFAAERAVWVVIHQNKAADNVQMKGHLGSILDEAAVENYSVSRNKGVFAVTPVSARRSYIDDDTKGFTFALDEAGTIVDAAAIIAKQEQQMHADWLSNMQRIFGDDVELPRSEIARRIMEAENLGETAAKIKVTSAINHNAIVKTGAAHRAPYRINDDGAVATTTTKEIQTDLNCFDDINGIDDDDL